MGCVKEIEKTDAEEKDQRLQCSICPVWLKETYMFWFTCHLV